jgi:dolichol-phosphate hexosyltransferase
MYKNKVISIIIPCYNEEKAIRDVLTQIPSYIDEVLVIDNNSSDRTAVTARECGAIVISENRKGYGYACKRGIVAARGDIIAAMDGDGTYAFIEIKKMIDTLIDNNLDFVSGNRLAFLEKRNMKAMNYIGNLALSFFVRVIFSCRIVDSQSGTWVFRKNILGNFNLVSNGMSLSEEIKIEAVKAPSVKFSEISIKYKNRIGNSKLNIWKDGLTNLLFLFIKRFRSRRGAHGR